MFALALFGKPEQSADESGEHYANPLERFQQRAACYRQSAFLVVHIGTFQTDGPSDAAA